MKTHIERKPRVYVVDDEPDFLAILERWLSPQYEILPFRSAEDLLKRAPPGLEADVIITDVIMPGLDGFALAQRLGADARFARAAVLFLTGVPPEKGLFPSLEAGGSAYLAKPIERVPLLEQLEKLLDRQAF
jgi:CheY-like chemotaxis protein